MKILGVTGSFGKTSVAEILYQYFLYINKKTILYSTNGIFKNGETITKDFFATSLSRVRMENELAKLSDEDIDYVVLEIKGELFLNDDKYVNCDIVGLSNFYPSLNNNFEQSVGLYRLCKKRALSCGEIKMVGPTNVDEFPDLQTTVWEKYEGITLDPISFEVDGEVITSNLCGRHHLWNLSLAIQMLKAMNEFNIDEFKNYALNINIRGRDNVFNVRGKTVVLDTGWGGVSSLVKTLKQMFNNDDLKYRIVFVPFENPIESVTTEKYRENAKNTLSSAEGFYGVSSLTKWSFRARYMRETYDFEKMYLDKDKLLCFDKALNDLQNDEIMIIVCRGEYRNFKHIIEQYQNN